MTVSLQFSFLMPQFGETIRGPKGSKGSTSRRTILDKTRQGQGSCGDGSGTDIPDPDKRDIFRRNNDPNRKG